MSYEFYNAWRTISSTPSQQYREDLQEFINDQFENASNLLTIQFQNRDTLVYEDIEVRLTTPFKLRQLSNIKDDYREVLFKDNTFQIYLGERFYFHGSYWITLDTGKIETPTSSCQIQRCNNTLKFYDEEGNYCEIPCIAQSGNVYDVEQDKMIWYPSNTMKVFVKYDEIGRKIKSDRRFLLNGTPWRTGDVNSVKYVRNDKGYIEFFVTADVISTNDNLTLGIADYYTQSATYNLTILNGSTLSVNLSTPIQISVEVTKTQNSITTLVTPTPSITYISSDITKATVSNTGLVTMLQTGNVNITAKLTSDVTVSDVLGLTIVSAPVNNYTYTLIGNNSPDTSIKLNSTATYVVKRFNNNVEIFGEDFDFEVIAGSTPNNKYIFTVIDDNSCSIKGLGYPYSITLRAYLRSDHLVYIDKVIQLKGVI